MTHNGGLWSVVIGGVVLTSLVYLGLRYQHQNQAISKLSGGATQALGTLGKAAQGR